MVPFSRTKRYGALLLFLPAASIFIGLLAYRHPSFYRFPSCPTHYLFGIYCPGCGSLRATHYLLQLDWKCSLVYNPLVLILLPVVIFLLGRWIVEIVWEKNRNFPGEILLGRLILFLILLFTLLRNIPVSSFDFLRPPI